MVSWSKFIIGTAGKDRLVGTSANEIYSGNGDDDVLVASGGNDIMYGGDGIDTVSYESRGSVTVNLGRNGDPGSATRRIGGASPGDPVVTQTDTLHSIENAIGSRYNDSLYGNELDNVLAGLAGADTINGWSGTDTVDYQASQDAVSIDLRLVTQHGGDAEGDRLYLIENVVGSAKADTIVGNSQANVLQGGDGNDTLAGYEGADTLDGGDGTDTADYSYTPRTGYFTGVTVNLSTGEASGASSLVGGANGLADGDILVSIENVIGTGRGDRLTGNEEANTLDGGKGEMDDILAGLGGADTLIGGAGLTDFADYLASPEGVSVNLETQENRYGHAEGDRLVDIEAVRGSRHDDELIGDENFNSLLGERGNDRLSGGTFIDTLAGGDGDDILEGGEGGDQLLGGNVVLLGTNTITLAYDTTEYDGSADTFVYRSVNDSPAAPGRHDVIFMFEHRRDVVDLSAIDADVHASGDQAFEFVSSFTGRAGELMFEPALDPQLNGYAGLGADVDGDAVADFAILFQLPSAMPTQEDFLL
jgi:Ca2+-binding RTX toxin-like protein